ncbi:MAG TPA: LapA family protein [Tepidisphaeraceae bacterium]|jgi:uncharacterized integral membrane protein
MGNLWLKIKVWTKSLIFGALLLYGLLFILNNSGQAVKFWYWPWKPVYETSMLVLILVTFLAGVIGTVLVRTTFKTLRQMRQLRERGRIERLERETADMKAKAAMLQTRTAGSAGSIPQAPMTNKAPMTNDPMAEEQ